MNTESHLKRAEEIKKSIDILKSEGGDVGSIVELVYGCSMHYILWERIKIWYT